MESLEIIVEIILSEKSGKISARVPRWNMKRILEEIRGGYSQVISGVMFEKKKPLEYFRNSWVKLLEGFQVVFLNEFLVETLEEFMVTFLVESKSESLDILQVESLLQYLMESLVLQFLEKILVGVLIKVCG